MFYKKIFIVFMVILPTTLSLSIVSDTTIKQENYRKSRASYLDDINIFNQIIGSVNAADVNNFVIDFKAIINQYIPKVDNFERFSLDTYGIIDIPTLNEYVAPDPTLYKHYDFIIVGAGPAGCVLANRLSENPHWRVLLLEAGNPEIPLTNIPIAAGYLQQTSFNWGYKAERSDKFCLGMEDQQCGFPRGKALGGSSVINYMIYNRGNRRDFDSWPEGWSYEEVLPYFLKSEGANLIGLENSPYHNHNGPWSVEDPRYRTRIAEAFVNASIEAGHPQIDYNGESQIGVSFVQANTLWGRRHSAARAYLDPIRKYRPNLDILVNARVTKVLIDHHTKVAYGVDYVHDYKRYSIHCKKEVILSAGTFNSPQLLMLSGIGQKNQLDAAEISQICDSPVGLKMFDHVSHFGPTFTVNTTFESINVFKVSNLPALSAYLRGQGPFTVIGGVEALTFLKTSNSDQADDVPDVELIFVSGSLQSDQGEGLRRGMRITEEIYNTVYAPLIATDVYTVMPILFRPKSYGHLDLRNQNPGSPPLIYPNFYDDESDLEKMLEGIKEAIRISEMPAMQKIGARLHSIPLPNCVQHTFGTDDYWRCSLRTLSSTIHHQTGTCRMGPYSDSYAVVSPKLKVYGVKRLRVVDTSVIPYSPTSHTNAASFMIGEKAADMIIHKWSHRTVDDLLDNEDELE